MADRFYQTAVTVTAGTVKAAPSSTVWKLEDAFITTVTIIVPDGHSGLTGIRLLRSFQQVIPYGNDDWIVANNDEIVIPYNGEITASGLSIQTYNTDVFDHSFNLRCVITDSLPGSGSIVSPIPIISNGLLNLPPSPAQVSPLG